MTDDLEAGGRATPVDELQDALRTELRQNAYTQAAAEKAKRGKWLRRAGLVALGMIAIVPGAIALGEIGGEPSPAPPPALSPESTCPPDVQAFLRELRDDPSKLGEYSETAGYPVAGCPTVEELEPIIETRHAPAA